MKFSNKVTYRPEKSLLISESGSEHILNISRSQIPPPRCDCWASYIKTGPLPRLYWYNVYTSTHLLLAVTTLYALCRLVSFNALHLSAAVQTNNYSFCALTSLAAACYLASQLAFEVEQF